MYYIYICFFNQNAFDFINVTVSQVDLSIERHVILQKKIANISNLISRRFVFRKVTPLMSNKSPLLCLKFVTAILSKFSMFE